MPAPLATLRRPATPATLRRLATATVVALSLIVATGGTVRLTRSGLGCDSWPNCGTPDGWHAAIEYGNRVAGILVGLVIVATLVAVLRLQPRRPELSRPAWWLLAGFFGQALLGALSVVLQLAPLLVMAHFLLSMALLAVAVVLSARVHHPGGEPGEGDSPAPTSLAHLTPSHPTPSHTEHAQGRRVRPELVTLAAVLVVATAVVLVLGTLTTGTGPHSGANPAKPAPRFTFLPLHAISMIHGNAAVLVVGLALANVLALRATDAPAAIRRTSHLVVAAVCGQASIGIVQYALGLPRGLVALHMVGATLLWVATLSHLLTVRRAAAAVPAPLDRPATASA